MATIQIIVLGIIQGLTEFLPISSSGHLILVPQIIGFPDQGMIFDVAVHLGSLIAVTIYFRHDLFALFLATFFSRTKKSNTDNSNLLFYILLATIPAAAAGYLLSGWIEETLRNPLVIAITLSFYGLLMWYADGKGAQRIEMKDMRLSHIILIGISQSLALVPGTSRSGVTMTTALLLGLKRVDAAKFSFLLSIPVITIASVYKFLNIIINDIHVDWSELFLGMLVAMIVAYLSIGFFMRIIRKVGLAPFAIYRVILSAIILYLFYF